MKSLLNILFPPLIALSFFAFQNQVYAECSCDSETYNLGPVEHGFLFLHAATPPESVEDIDICIWSIEPSGDSMQINQFPVKGTRTIDGYKFRIDRALDARGTANLEVLPRIKTRKIVGHASLGNQCFSDTDVCHIGLVFELEKTWDVEVKIISDNTEIYSKLGNMLHAKPITKYGRCPRTKDNQFSEMETITSPLTTLSTYQVDEDTTLNLSIEKSEDGNEDHFFRKTLLIKIEETDFDASNKKIYFLKDLLESANKGSELRGINGRRAKSVSREYWGVTDYENDESKIVVKKLVLKE